jgi:hypothetical protein
MFPLIANAQTSFVASEIDNPTNKCQVIVADYRVGSDINYLGNCSWSSLKGIGAYVEKWNHGNHVRVVRGNFKKGQSTDWSKVTYFNLLKKTVVSSEENSWLTRNRTVYQIDDVIADMVRSKVDIDLSKVSTYLVIANFIDLYE